MYHRTRVISTVLNFFFSVSFNFLIRENTHTYRHKHATQEKEEKCSDIRSGTRVACRENWPHDVDQTSAPSWRFSTPENEMVCSTWHV